MSEPECICPYTPPETWLSAASCGYGSGYEPGSMQEWDPDCPAHPPTCRACAEGVAAEIASCTCAGEAANPGLRNEPNQPEEVNG